MTSFGIYMITEKMQLPLVSCIMPTYNRREFVPHAIRYFLRQDYANKELVVIDDGTDDVSDLVPKDERIRYFRLDKKATLGAKLNLACEHARGTIIAHWDDDDWYAARRLGYQVETLLHERTDVCGVNNLLYYDLCTRRAYQYIYPADQRTWLSGSSLCYIKNLWMANRFADIDVGMDGLFVRAVPPHCITVLQDSTFSVFMMHAHNVSPKMTDGAWWHPYPAEKIRQILGPDWAFYQNDHRETASSPHPRTTVSERQAEKPAKPVRNVFACLVHESQECVIDLVRNLRYHDPSSVILLYDGGKDPGLLHDHFPFERYGAELHPASRPIVWGCLHTFALDCMQFALDNFAFDTLTIVDSDQLGIRSGYSNHLGQFLSGQTEAGMLGNSPSPLPSITKVAPAVQAFKEIELWRPFLRGFSEGETKFVHWTFWPSTVFTADSARDLTQIFATNQQLQYIMRHTKIWATEEVILPTLVNLLGYKTARNPCSYDYVKYRMTYSLQQIDSAIAKTDVFWIHPIMRRYDNGLRKYIRERFNHYQKTALPESKLSSLEANADPGLLLTFPILTAMNKVEGWLEEDEADLLMVVCRQALVELPQTHSIVELGSYCGRSTVVLGSVVKAICPEAKVYAIDPHNGEIGALDQGIRKVTPTLEKFKLNITKAGLADVVETIQEYSFKVSWEKPISLLLIDGLHDYVNIARDFFHFERWVVNEGYIVFHDYANYYPGVPAFVNELLDSGNYRKVHRVGSMMVILKERMAETSQDVEPTEQLDHRERT